MDPVAPAVLALGGLALVLGAFLPWLHIAGQSFSGVSGDLGSGRATLAAGVVALVAAAAALRGGLDAGRSVGLGLAGAFACARALYGRSRIQTLADLVGDAGSQPLPPEFAGVASAFLEVVTPSVGEGIWLTLVGGLLVIVGAVLALVRSRTS